jgi:hypothetical protein
MLKKAFNEVILFNLQHIFWEMKFAIDTDFMSFSFKKFMLILFNQTIL